MSRARDGARRPRARTAVRLLEPADAAGLARLLTANREFLAPFEPERDEGYATEAGQAALIAHLLAEHAAGRVVPYAVVHDGDLVGRSTVSEVVRGPAQSGDLGYFVAEEVNGRGVATEAVARTVEAAFGELGLHRLQAGTLLSNSASQAVLQRNGFERIGVARGYLRVAGRWQDHVLYQRTA
ncbi:GNAT family N-acetyltransferase [Paenibacillus sp. TRM 82003]|uniref:GNAT family N-acetyltransferase n=1 Tax=Kineococcus sp. TRM81007 TaxID=2925831 RepID=UPI001F572AA4|nr:GNAT family protein [Kineococcus sp. TRM81007]MCI2240413.1 GNAT family N-acetyltransferase [Kineococcus sp. TRM81007]MCI3927411.1 GNAT family N-acetyltransferase [Paenibacillus sp. TRM 82003]